MNLILPILFLLFFVIGVSFSFLLFKQDKDNKKSTKFLTSERLLVFGIEIMIAVIGFGVTLAITNANERWVEKEKASNMIQQVIEFTDRQITRERSYLNMYNNGKLDAAGLRVSNIINLDYYNNILSTDAVLHNTNMNTYGDIMTYLVWIQQRNDLAQTAEEEHVYTYMSQRYTHLKLLRELLSVCHEELTGAITAEEASRKCNDIKYPSKTETTVPATS